MIITYWLQRDDGKMIAVMFQRRSRRMPGTSEKAVIPAQISWREPFALLCNTLRNPRTTFESNFLDWRTFDRPQIDA